MKILAVIYPESVSLYKTSEHGFLTVFIGEIKERISVIGAYNNEWCLSMWNHPHSHFLFVDLIQKGD